MLAEYYIEIVVLIFIFTYGIAFGFKNWLMRLNFAVSRKKMVQSDTGKYLDALLIVAILYLLLFQLQFITTIIEMIN